MALKIVSVNVNGVRAAFRNGMPAWLSEVQPDILALQEVRAETEDLLRLFNEYEAEHGGEPWHILHDNATAKGRAGVAVVSRLKPQGSRTELGPKSFDSAGRWLEVDFKIG